MNAEQYIRTKKRLSCALNGQDRLMEAVKDIEAALVKHNLDGMPEAAFDVMCFTLETIHLKRLDTTKFVAPAVETSVPNLTGLADLGDTEVIRTRVREVPTEILSGSASQQGGQR